mmetsp:Transcript_62141/g.196552  ORF Transcript_62141/g.196552 Transcript_62141/m.196552 type:complete len:122 (+) Transcript_62141:195-560(+)
MRALLCSSGSPPRGRRWRRGGPQLEWEERRRVRAGPLHPASGGRAPPRPPPAPLVGNLVQVKPQRLFLDVEGLFNQLRTDDLWLGYLGKNSVKRLSALRPRAPPSSPPLTLSHPPAPTPGT